MCRGGSNSKRLWKSFSTPNVSTSSRRLTNTLTEQRIFDFMNSSGRAEVFQFRHFLLFLFQLFWLHKDHLPNDVLLQMDNTVRENKNQFVEAFLAYLVEKKVLDVVSSFYLMYKCVMWIHEILPVLDDSEVSDG